MVARPCAHVWQIQRGVVNAVRQIVQNLWVVRHSGKYSAKRARTEQNNKGESRNAERDNLSWC